MSRILTKSAIGLKNTMTILQQPAFRAMSSEGLKSSYEFIKAEIHGNAGLITLNRPKALNALCDGLLKDVIHAARVF